MTKNIFPIALVLMGFSSMGFSELSNPPKMTNECTYLTENKTYGYCVTKTEGSRNPDILYHMHGAGQSQQAWVLNKKPIWEYYAENKIDPPTVVTMSFGPIWMLAQKNKSAASGLLEFVTNTYMPKIESEIGGLRGRRLLFGESMGGFNTGQLVMKRPDLFSKAAIICADFTSLLPYASAQEMQDWMKATGADLWHAAWETVMARIFFADNESWNQANALVIDKTDLNPRTPPLYMSAALQDEYGFLPGDREFAAQAKTNGVNITWEEYPGNHCVFNAKAVGDFLISP